MCGIFLCRLFGNNNNCDGNSNGNSNVVDSEYNDEWLVNLNLNFSSIQHRGPDDTKHMILNNYFMGFHRLAINGVHSLSDQPFVFMDNVCLVCNGEIYNHEVLKRKYGIETKSDSDCEVIYHLYKILGIQRACEELDGVFAFIIYDNGRILLGRDVIGVRPMFWVRDRNGIVAVASEVKALKKFGNMDGGQYRIEQFPPHSYYDSGVHAIGANNGNGMLIRYNDIVSPYNNLVYEGEIYECVRNVFIRAVEKRLMSNRPIGCLLSGG